MEPTDVAEDVNGRGIRDRSAPADPAAEADPGPDVTEVDDRGTGNVDRRVPWRIFCSIGSFVAFMAVLYGAWSREFAGTTMLASGAVLALWIGIFLWRTAERVEATLPAEKDRASEMTYLPEASPWPFGIGLGMVLTLNAFLIGAWALIPGVMTLVVCVIGWANQSRHRR